MKKQPKKGNSQKKNMKDIGLQILVSRKELKLNQHQFAEEIGVSRIKIALWEEAKRIPNIIEFLRIMEVTGKPIEFFCKGVKAAKSKPAGNQKDVLESIKDTLNKLNNKIDKLK